MERNLFRATLFLICSALFQTVMVSCSNPMLPGGDANSIVSGETVISRSSIADPAAAIYLGDGYDLLKIDPLGCAVDSASIARWQPGTRIYTMNYQLIEDSYELNKTLDSSFSASVSASVFDIASVGGSLSDSIKRAFTFSSKSVSYLVRMRYVHYLTFLDAPTMTESARTMYLSNPDQFRATYGDGYVRQALLGEEFYFVMSYDYANVTNKLDTEIREAANVKFLDIVEGNQTAEAVAKADSTLSKATLTGQVIATGGWSAPFIPTTRAEFLSLYQSFQNFLASKISASTDTTISTQFDVLERKFNSYAVIVGSPSLEIDSFYLKQIEWRKLIAQVEVAKNDNQATYAAVLACNNELERLAHELSKCTLRSADARYPAVNECGPFWTNLDSLTPPTIEVRYATSFSWVWNDKGSGAKADGEFYRPVLPAGYYSIGHLGQNYYGTPTGYLTIVKPIDATAIAYPTGYQRIWYDKGSGAKYDGSFWKPVAPPGYVAMGTVSQRGWGQPSLSEIVCIRADLVTYGVIGGLIWKDTGSGAKYNFSSWDVQPADMGTSVDTGCFLGNSHYSQPNAADAYCFKKDKKVKVITTW